MIFIPLIEDRSEPLEFISEEWESGERGRAAAERMLSKAQQQIAASKEPDATPAGLVVRTKSGVTAGETAV